MINFLNRSSSGGAEAESTGFFDTNGDGEISPIDVLTVINALSRGSNSSSQSQTDKTTTDDSQVPATEVDVGDDGDTKPDEKDCNNSTNESIGHRSVPGFALFGLNRQTSTKLLDRFDDNADEILEEEEVPARLWKKLIDQGVDANEDGSISLEELDTAVTTARTKVFNDKDTDANGLLSESEVSKRFWTKLSAADTNADSSISFKEFDVWLDESATTIPSPGHEHHSHPADTIFANFGQSRD